MTKKHLGVLTNREEQIARLIAGGLSNIQVAAQLGVSAHRVRNALASVYAKTNCSNRVQLARWMWERDAEARAAD